MKNDTKKSWEQAVAHVRRIEAAIFEGQMSDNNFYSNGTHARLKARLKDAEAFADLLHSEMIGSTTGEGS